MSNIGKQRIFVPKNVKVECKGWKLTAVGEYGQAFINFPIYTSLILKDNYLTISGGYIKSSLYGTYQRKLKALIHGLSLIYRSHLKFVGVGYRAHIENNFIILRLGYSHEISLPIPVNLKVSVVKRNNVKLIGSNLEEVRQYAYKLRSYRRPEPFKGKGVVILGEVVRRKEGKKKKV
jgi:large subunit ribosomal protein L6